MTQAKPTLETRHTTDSPDSLVLKLLAAESILKQLASITEAGASTIKSQCSQNGRLDLAKLDEHQQTSYDLAFMVAEISAANASIRYARQVDFDPMATSVTLVFCAQTIKNTLERLLVRPADFGQSRQDILSIYSAEVLEQFFDEYQNSAVLADLGKQICDADLVRLASALSEEKELVRETFYRFANEVVEPLAEEIHRQDLDIPDEILKPAAELGCFGTCIPEEYGGLQPNDRPDSLGMIVVTEELSRGSLGAAGSLITRPEIAARALLSGGTEQQRQQWLPQLASGETLCAISITEPNTGSDVAAVSLKATRVQRGWTLNGAKTWCTFAGKSELLVVLARTEPDASLGYKGLSLFLLQKPSYSGHEFIHQQENGGALTGRAIATLGYRGMHSFDLFFEDYFVPDDSLLGGDAGLGKGFYFTMAGFAGGRIQTAARATGLMQAAFEKALSYAKDRKVFGKAVADYQLTQIKLVRMLAALNASRQFSYEVARLMDDGGGQMEASLVKLYSCRAAEWITREALQIHGGMGYAEEAAVSRYFVDARVLSIFEGAEETLALKVIARELIAKAS
ncbi:MAG: (2S)-methylsuccinyl-CoA dehydrogenase [Pseudohongiellaceae bacterium]|jgi:(2S)-methylsuccinyl-CoA dehydrogenase